MYRDNSVQQFENDIYQESANSSWKEFTKVIKDSPNLDHRRSLAHSPTRKYYTPTQEQLDVLLPNPIQCFCNKRAHKTYTAEYGPIYECASFDHDNSDSSKFQSKYICGFHIHERSWTKLIDDLKQGKDINLEFLELRTCPQYNFTFCSILRVSNSYTLAHPDKIPECFCRKPVVMRTSRQGSIQFACKNGLLEGARKCSWVLPANEVAFPKPKIRLHSLLDHDQYMNQQQSRREELNQRTMSNHKTHLLATLLANQPSTSSLQETNTMPPIRSPETVSTRMPEEKGFIVPTSVMAKKQQKAKQISPSSSSVSSNMSTPIIRPFSFPEYTSDEKDEIIQKYKDAILELQQTNEELKQKHVNTTNQMREQHIEAKEKMMQLQTDLYRMKNERLEESIFTVNCQERLSNIELEMVRFMNENQKLTDEILCLRTEKLDLMASKEDEPNKCIVCYTQNIECCLKPCYHYAYCQACAIKLTSCAICRRAVKSVQRIYQS